MATISTPTIASPGRGLGDNIPLGREPESARPYPRDPSLYASIVTVWLLVLIWFYPRLVQLLDLATGPITYASLLYFVVFMALAWLYGLYNIGIVSFSIIYRRAFSDTVRATSRASAFQPPVAILYTTCNDFVRLSVVSCVRQDYGAFTVYILDDSSDPKCQAQVDAFASAYPEKVVVIRRPTRQGFKAGNLNYALTHHVKEAYFAIADADEILPSSFLSKLVPRMLADPTCGFIQANHRCASHSGKRLNQDLRVGVDIHWKWYQPLRNRYGFVMFLGHGALLRRSCWTRVRGFPELVSEDLAYAIAVREIGYVGRFAEDIVCLEEFPDSVRAFRVRHIKWTRGTCELLSKTMGDLLRSRAITWPEKLDILFPTLNLPMSFFFFIFMVNSALLPYTMGGEWRDITLAVGSLDLVLPVVLMPEGLTRIYSYDLFLITIMTILAPVMCFILELWRQPIRLFRFLCHSTALYAALSPLSFLGVFGFMLTRKAGFLVTGDRGKRQSTRHRATLKERCAKFFAETHPDHVAVRGFELTTGVIFLFVAAAGFQIAFFGLALAFICLPLMHRTDWRNGVSRVLVWIPFSLIMIALLVGGASVLGLQPMLFGFGFHF